MKKIMKCKKCENEMYNSEEWVDFNEEQRHVQYYICTKCKLICDVSGNIIVEKEKLKSIT